MILTKVQGHQQITPVSAFAKFCLHNHNVMDLLIIRDGPFMFPVFPYG